MLAKRNAQKSNNFREKIEYFGEIDVNLVRYISFTHPTRSAIALQERRSHYKIGDRTRNESHRYISLTHPTRAAIAFTQGDCYNRDLNISIVLEGISINCLTSTFCSLYFLVFFVPSVKYILDILLPFTRATKRRSPSIVY